MPDDLKDTAVEELVDLGRILIILVKEGIVAGAVVVIGRLIAYFAVMGSPRADWVAATIQTISDLGAVFLFVILVCKDLWTYLRRR